MAHPGEEIGGDAVCRVLGAPLPSEVKVVLQSLFADDLQKCSRGKRVRQLAQRREAGLPATPSPQRAACEAEAVFAADFHSLIVRRGYSVRDWVNGASRSSRRSLRLQDLQTLALHGQECLLGI